MRIYFDVTKGELSFTENSETLVIPTLSTTSGNFQTVIDNDAKIKIIKKLVATLK